MRIVLAPLEGVMDHTVRELLTRLGGYDLCVTEFLRVSNHQLLPPRTFYQLAPELENNGFTASGVPVRMQLLGSQPDTLAMNAQRAIELGSHGIDLNLGCPAKTVNKSKGGAALLKEPQLIADAVAAMRKVVPVDKTLSVKIRLGWDDPNCVHEIVDAIVSAGADELTIHARTKEDGYNAEAIKWHYIAQVKERLARDGKNLSIIANGEIWNIADALECRKISGCDDLMIGRGALATPNLAAIVAGISEKMSWLSVVEMILDYRKVQVISSKGHHYSSRVKQWLSQMRQSYAEAHELFMLIKRIKKCDDMQIALERYLDALMMGRVDEWRRSLESQ
ncbi:MAG: tRNA-dihydrouridine synthase C [Oleispira sp.]|jgi:tRNA-dihydrouridine synthase C